MVFAFGLELFCCMAIHSYEKHKKTKNEQLNWLQNLITCALKKIKNKK